MRSDKDDRRVKYTKMVLRQSFLDLLEKKDISQISIKEICEDADINRATFYAHYNDQYDLMKKIEAELFTNLKHYLSEYEANGAAADTVEMVERIFEYISENAKLCKLLLSERGDLNFQKHLMMLVYDPIISNLTKKGAISKEEAEYIYSFTLTGCLGIVQKWLQDGMAMPTRWIAEMIVNLSMFLQDGSQKMNRQ